MYDRTRRPAPNDRVAWKVAIFFVAAAVWGVGALLDNPAITGAAIVLLAVALLFRIVERRREEGERGDE